MKTMCIRFCLFVCSAAILLLSSCAPGNVYEDHQTLKDQNLLWTSGDVRTFDVNIAEAGNYNIFIELRFTGKMRNESVPLQIMHKNTENVGNQKDFTFPIWEGDSKRFGEASQMGDLVDKRVKYAENVTLDAGKHTFEIGHGAKGKSIPGMLEVGLIIEKVQP